VQDVVQAGGDDQTLILDRVMITDQEFFRPDGNRQRLGK
jgi:hypothetical protein